MGSVAAYLGKVQRELLQEGDGSEEGRHQGPDEEDEEEYKDGSLCGYCAFCEHCDECEKCPCEEGDKSEHCEDCKYCQFCYVCPVICETVCKPGSYVDEFSSTIYQSIANIFDQPEH